MLVLLELLFLLGVLVVFAMLVLLQVLCFFSLVLHNEVKTYV